MQNIFRSKLAQIVGFSVLILVGFVIGSLIRSHSSSEVNLGVASRSSAIVKVTEEKFSNNLENENAHQRKTVRIAVGKKENYSRRSYSVKMMPCSGNKSNQESLSETPASVVLDQNSPNNKDGGGSNIKLPKPTDLNDAQTNDSNSIQ